MDGRVLSKTSQSCEVIKRSLNKLNFDYMSEFGL